MGSDSDLEVMNETAQVLKDFKVLYEMKVLSAHRSPEDVQRFVKQAKSRGFKVMICGAGGAAHLAGVVAAQTTLPVIGVPINSSALGGLDALLATVQMPAGIPVATVAIGKAGARNAAILACQMLSLKETSLQGKLAKFKQNLAASIRKKNDHLKKQLQS
ncbi:MAG: 5-(carboxyamino)imidazole ribonucleotide mutase [Candidatus Omnitrophica bacterium]|nr:5-(carboxyamino)imidazole ribonucleotide mutase [Candidatus Omnitrophota bacterium]